MDWTITNKESRGASEKNEHQTADERLHHGIVAFVRLILRVRNGSQTE
jgi:hypothetical protein